MNTTMAHKAFNVDHSNVFSSFVSSIGIRTTMLIKRGADFVGIRRSALFQPPSFLCFYSIITTFMVQGKEQSRKLPLVCMGYEVEIIILN